LAALAAVGAGGLIGCGALTGDQPLPAGISDPGSVSNAVGAAGMVTAARAQFQWALALYIPQAGLLTDELQANARGTLLANNAFPDKNVAVDARLLPEGSYTLGTDNVYSVLQQLRALTNQAIGALEAYAPDSSANRRGEMYALEGYAEVMLADLFCSGVPLSTSNFSGGYTFAPSSTTQEVYQHALVLFDSALTLAHDSTPIVGLATVGKARALTDLGQYAQAAQAVSNLPVSFVFSQPIQECGSTTNCQANGAQAKIPLAMVGSVSDSEGEVGLPYFSSGDPRTMRRATPIGVLNGDTIWFPAKYTYGGVNTIVVASGIEAQLIQAEAALQAGSSTWLDILNALRTDGTQTGGVYDAGTGGVAGLAPLTDPGATIDRQALLFRERAFWLYLTGQRQGDLRRLVTQYRWPSGTVYPRGVYPNLGAYGASYSTNIDAPIPQTELYNSLYKGCLSRDMD
jgi:hypothetical protein